MRLIGFSWNVLTYAAASALYDKLDTMRGLDENGGNVDTAQVMGTIHIDSLTGAQMASLQERYPDITVTYSHIESYLYYYNFEGDTLLYTETIQDGGNGTYAGQPSHASTAANTYTFIGWALTPNQTTANANARNNVTADRRVYAAYQLTGQTYTVTFARSSADGGGTLQTVNNVPYGGSTTYTGATPTTTKGSASDYPFQGWSPQPTNIQGNTTCYAVFGSPVEVAEITDSWDQIIASIANGTYATKYKIGNYKPLDLGAQGIVNMQIVAKDTDPLASGSGNAPLTFVSKELLVTTHRMNPSRAADPNDSSLYQEGTGTIGGWEKTEMRTYLRDTIKPLIPSNVRSAIKEVTKYSKIYNTSSTAVNNVTSTDDVWIPSYREIFGGTSYETSGPVYTTIFTDATSRIKNNVSSGSAAVWWLRSAIGDYNFMIVSSYGTSNGYYAYSSRGVALGFCL